MGTYSASKFFQEQKDQVLYWINLGCDLVACDTRIKKPLENWSENTGGEPNYGSRLEDGFLNQWDKMVNYDDGVAVICGQLRRGQNKGKWLSCFDFDSSETLDKFCDLFGTSLDELARKTLVEWHGSPEKIHIFFMTNSPLKDLAVNGFEIKASNKRLAFVSPSPYKDGIENYRAYDKFNTSIAIIDNIEKKRFESVIELLVKALTNEEKSYFEGSDETGEYIDYLESEGTVLRAGERHDGTVRMAASMFFRYKNGWGELSDDDRFDKLVEWHKKHCQPSLFEEYGRGNELKVIWNDICRKYTDRRKEERDNRPQSNTGSKIDDENKIFEKELTAKYHFKSMKDNKVLYYFDEREGIYIKNGEWLIEQECVKFDPEVTTKQVTDVKNRIIYSNYTDTSSGDPWQFDSDIEWIAAENCLINLKTLETKGFGPENLITRKIPHRYENDQSFIIDFWEWVGDYSYRYYYNSCPKIMRFLNQVMAPEDVETVLDFMAYCLWRGLPFHKYLLLCGSGRNGKGVTMDLIKRLLGRQNVSNESLQRILETRYAVAQLYGKLANIDADLSNEALENTGILKKLTGGDELPGEFKFKTPFGFANFAKLIFSCNQMPETPDETDAFFARLIIINFPNQFLGDNADPYLIDKLTTDEEMTGLFSILINRLPKVLTRGIYVPLLSNSIAENYEKYIQSSNPIRAFIETMIDKDTDIAMNSSVLRDDLYRAYKRYCNDRQLSVEGNQTFSRKLKKEHGMVDQQLRVDGKREWLWISIKLKEYVKVDEDQETF